MISSNRSEKDPKTSYGICVLASAMGLECRGGRNSNVLHGETLDDVVVRSILELREADLVRQAVDLAGPSQRQPLVQ